MEDQKLTEDQKKAYFAMTKEIAESGPRRMLDFGQHPPPLEFAFWANVYEQPTAPLAGDGRIVTFVGGKFTMFEAIEAVYEQWKAEGKP